MQKEEVLTVADGPSAPDGSAPPLYILRISQGPGAGQSLLLDWAKRPVYLVGQGPLCDLRLADQRASRRHLSVAPHGSLLRVTDLGSSNGTRVGGLRIVEALLAGGEVLEVGDTQLRVARLPATAAPPPADRTHFGRVLGASFEMQRLFELVEKLSASPLNVILEGETGTGKELVAEAIHEAGPGATGPLVFVDCAGSAEQLDEALFGREHPGILEKAHGGTLVLSEVADLDPVIQALLVPFVENGVIQRLGTAESRRVDVRILCTTRRDVDREVQDGRLREDLLFRLGGARVEVPRCAVGMATSGCSSRTSGHSTEGRASPPRSCPSSFSETRGRATYASFRTWSRARSLSAARTSGSWRRAPPGARPRRQQRQRPTRSRPHSRWTSPSRALGKPWSASSSDVTSRRR